MKGQLYKEANVWLVEYEDTSFRKKIKKQIELHPDDVEGINDDGEYMNNYELKPINFEIMIISDEYNKGKLVAKITNKHSVKIEINKEDETI